ncbi:hypothetical protein K458DRAFT_464661 [Lentithecium fluviatile CBS 122367]|uniref:HTH psq-type domain-containing protein n=1 Tax=Lentithecium fluviatile CBS 122367 TaxID=1168545 RepID=A0A6G1JDJ6_9PLEO|nr:hypothetical protein K458DRAFT_464661 [Lentithecium fluviatile CBS 122367]
MANNKVNIQAALANYNAGIFTSQQAAAKAYNIPQSTFVDRLKGATTMRASHYHQQRLTPEQENFLVDWILNQDMKCYPPSHARAREMAS